MNALEVLQLLLRETGQWLTSAQVGACLVPAAADPKAVASEARRAERLLAAWDGERFWYPAFQFDETGSIVPRLDEFLQVLPRERNDRTLGLDAVLWVMAPDDALGGRSPADLFPTQPERVIVLARQRLGRDNEACD